MNVYILSHFVNKLEIWWLYLSPIEKEKKKSKIFACKIDFTLYIIPITLDISN